MCVFFIARERFSYLVVLFPSFLQNKNINKSWILCAYVDGNMYVDNVTSHILGNNDLSTLLTFHTHVSHQCVFRSFFFLWIFHLKGENTLRYRQNDLEINSLLAARSSIHINDDTCPIHVRSLEFDFFFFVSNQSMWIVALKENNKYEWDALYHLVSKQELCSFVTMTKKENCN